MDAAMIWKRLQNQSVVSLSLELGVSPKKLVRTLEMAGLLGNSPKDPTPRRIRVERRIARQLWTPAVTEARRIGRRCSNERM